MKTEPWDNLNLIRKVSHLSFLNETKAKKEKYLLLNFQTNKQKEPVT